MYNPNNSNTENLGGGYAGPPQAPYQDAASHTVRYFDHHRQQQLQPQMQQPQQQQHPVDDQPQFPHHHHNHQQQQILPWAPQGPNPHENYFAAHPHQPHGVVPPLAVLANNNNNADLQDLPTVAAAAGISNHPQRTLNISQLSGVGNTPKPQLPPLQQILQQQDLAPRSRGGDAATYVLRIHEMLEDSEMNGTTQVVSWQPHGRAFRIHHEPSFIRDIMPKYFKAKLWSFQRWLRAWGFVRMTEGKDRGAWYHRYFVRGVTELCKDLTRQQMQSSMIGWPPAGQVPDFYAAASGSTLSEQPQAAHLARALSSAQHVVNPKLLRGKVLEDIRQMLEDAEEEGNDHIVSWLPHGKAFRVHKRKDFAALMGRYFKATKPTYLSDTLRIWGFVRLRQDGPDRGAFYHKYFVRGDPSLSRHKTRDQMKKSMKGWNDNGEPNLYAPSAQGRNDLNDETGASAEPGDGAPTDPLHFLHNDQPHGPTGATAEQQSQQQLLDQHPPPGGGGHHNLPNDEYDFESSYAVALAATAGFPPPPEGQAIGENEPILADDGKGTGGGTPDGTYVLRIHQMLEDAEKEGNTGVVSWQPHGRAFRVHKRQEFVEQIMPRYFKAKVGSFVRWLRAWGFVRMTEGEDRGAWYHRYFVRGVTGLCRRMTRQQMLKAMEDWLPSGQVPNFYSSGTGRVLSEAPVGQLESPPGIECVKDPKRLRGTICEEVRAMLEDEGNSMILSWMPHGRAFRIHNKKVFTETILNRYCKSSKFTYFSDKLRSWGFHRIKSGRDKGSYYHKWFLRGQPQLTRHLSRIQMKDAMADYTSEDAPDLYDLLPLPGLPGGSKSIRRGGRAAIAAQQRRKQSNKKSQKKAMPVSQQGQQNLPESVGKAPEMSVGDATTLPMVDEMQIAEI